MKDLFKNKKNLYSVLIIFVVLIIGIIISVIYSNKINIRKVLSNKYNSIKCIDKYCKGIYASEEKDNNVYVKLLNDNGNIIGRYSYKASKKKVKEPYYLSESYMLMKKSISKKKTEYSINTKNAKEQYKTNNNLSSINENLILETIEADIDYKYNIYNASGKEMITGITDYESYVSGDILFGVKDTHSYIFSKSGKIILDGYKVDKEEDNYLILKSAIKDTYYYFNLDKEKIMNEGFSSYVINDDKTISVSRKENNSNVIYLISKNGRETKEKNKDYLYDVITKIEVELRAKSYDLYEESVIDENAENVFVDNKNDNSFGIYNIKENKYDKFYDYSTSAFESDIDVLTSLDGKVYLQISCAKPICIESRMYVYSYNDNKILFYNEGNDKIASEYHHFKNNYKVLKYSNRSKDEDYKNKYVLYNEKDEELEKSENYINVVDSTLIIGELGKKSLLYSSKSKKLINNEDTLAELVDDKYYKCGSVLFTKTGKEIYTISSNATLEYSNDYVYSLGNKSIKAYSIKTGKVYTYKFKNDESILSSDNKNLVPFKSIVYVNNNSKKYVKFINMKSNKAKKLSDNLIFKVYSNEDNSKNYIITRSTKKGDLKYGLYILD